MSNTKKIFNKIVCLLTVVVLLVGGIVGKNIYDIMANTSFEHSCFMDISRHSYHALAGMPWHICRATFNWFRTPA